MVNKQVHSVTDMIEALESFRRHHGDNAPVHIFSIDDCADFHTFPVCNVAEVTDESSDFWGTVEEPTLLLW